MKDGSTRVAVLIPAAGAGSRMGAAHNKVLLPLGGAPLIVHTVRAFQAHPRVDVIGVIARRADRAALDACFAAGARDKLLPWIDGGATRQDSVYNGLAALQAQPPAWVLVHDGARPVCRPALTDRVLAALADAPGAVPVLPVSETVRRIRGGRSEVVDRTDLYRTQTPQGFRWDVLLLAHRTARQQGTDATDDAQLVEAMGMPVAFVAGDADNVKVTTPDDLPRAAVLLGLAGGP